ncbi:hypothetical protein DICSQDRAFT_182295 [Dichomitus squalens LYAD-421 SS1]|uniref:Uncharacterized protein n=1 Tax=Dichomitus squalens (strain LYAD-421) TaxID=732165 RepID=R7SUY0_DICSQ|nr:uncharacterized protein DICSQDRAFT_182295 [Dichomitus squalens LYAD-421 SS1]EJF58772.1 hypothetical protein DICSQDRAFT_182295 [Dichomitus squalens LYAD-421 SS1]
MIGAMGSSALVDTPDTRCHPRPVAVQINDLDVIDFADLSPEVLLQVTRAKASHLSLSLNPALGDDCSRQLVLSARGPEGTFHISTDTFEDSPDLQIDWDDFRFVLSAGQHLQAVREVWITGIPPQNSITAAFKSVIAALPALETVVFVITRVTSETDVNSSLCPDPPPDPGFASHKLKTLRLAYGNDSYRRGSVVKLSLRRLLEQVETGAYGYFQTLILQMTGRLVVRNGELRRLQARFATVTFEHIGQMPTMSLPDYCVEPYAGPGGSSSWPGSLW